MYFFSQPKAEWTARLGTIRLTSTSPWQQERLIVEMEKSPVEGSTIVLAKMDRPIDAFSDFVRPVCLPGVNEVASTAQCNTLGWAKNREYPRRPETKGNKIQALFSPFRRSLAEGAAEVHGDGEVRERQHSLGQYVLHRGRISDGRLQREFHGKKKNFPLIIPKALSRVVGSFEYASAYKSSSPYQRGFEFRNKRP